MTQGGADKREWGLFEPGNVGAYPGREIELKAGQKETILDIRETDDRGAQLITVQLAAHPKRPDADTFRAVFAELEWGIAGGRDRCIVDFLKGQCITVAGTFLRVNGIFPRGNVNPPGWPPVIPEPETFGEPAEQYQDPATWDQQAILVGANIAPQPHPQAAFGSTPRLSIYVELPPAEDPDTPGLSAFIRVPPHAQSVTILSNTADFEPSLISFHTMATTGSSLYSEPFPLCNYDADGAIPIARGVEWIQLQNEETFDGLVILLFTIGL